MTQHTDARAMTQPPARKICSQCGAHYQPVKPWHVICFDCYIARARGDLQARQALSTPKAKPASLATLARQAYNTSKRIVTKAN